MKRVELLKTENQEKMAVKAQDSMVRAEKRAFDKKLSDLQYELDVKQDELDARMSSSTPVDESVVRVHFAEIERLTQEIVMWESFVNSYYA